MESESQQSAQKPLPQNISVVNSVPPNRRIFIVITIGVLLFLFIVVGVVGYFLGKKQLKENTFSILNPTHIVDSTLTPTSFYSELTPTTYLESIIPSISSEDTEAQARTYINEIAGFKMAFPINWQIPNSVYKDRITPAGDGPGPGVGFQITKFATPINTMSLPLIHVEAYLTDMEDTDLIGQAKRHCSWTQQDHVSSFMTEEILVGGHNAVNIGGVITWDDPKHYASCTLVYGNPGLIINWHNDTEAKGDIDEILNNITFL